MLLVTNKCLNIEYYFLFNISSVQTRNWFNYLDKSRLIIKIWLPSKLWLQPQTPKPLRYHKKSKHVNLELVWNPFAIWWKSDNPRFNCIVNITNIMWFQLIRYNILPTQSLRIDWLNYNYLASNAIAYTRMSFVIFSLIHSIYICYMHFNQNFLFLRYDILSNKRRNGCYFVLLKRKTYWIYFFYRIKCEIEIKIKL